MLKTPFNESERSRLREKIILIKFADKIVKIDHKRICPYSRSLMDQIVVVPSIRG